MRIAIVNAVFPPEPMVSAQIGCDLAMFLAAMQVEVHVICPRPSRPVGVRYQKYDDRELLAPGLSVVRVSSYTSPEARVVARMLESYSFGIAARRELARAGSRFDVIYANTWPVFSQAVLAWHCAKQAIPFVLHVQDLYPEAWLVRLPQFLSCVLKGPLTRVDRWIASRANYVIAASRSIERAYVATRMVEPGRITTLMNWQDESRFANGPDRDLACRNYGVDPSPFTFLYLGNIGPVADLETVIEAFSRGGIADAQLVIAGDGSAKTKCLALVKRLNARRIVFVSDPNVNNVPTLQAMAHVCVLPMRAGTGQSSVPSKLAAYLLSGRPVLAVVDGTSDIAECVRESGCGWLEPAGDVVRVAGRMAAIRGVSATELSAKGEAGRTFALRFMAKVPGVTRMAQLVVEAGTRGAGGAP